MNNHTLFLVPLRLSCWFLFIILSFKTAVAYEDDARYAAIDRYALAAPASVTKSVKELSAYLTKPFRTDEEKARAIFRWITDNISYDVEGFFSGRESASTSSDVLQSRSSVCSGYSTLFEELGNAAGLQVATIDGYAKGFGYQPGDRIPDESNHTWNAVKINGEWKLIDCTWGAGKVEDDHAYRKEYEPYYFFTKPEEFVYRHFPKEKLWQLLPRPISRQEFLNLPLAGPIFFQYGFIMDSPQRAVLDLESENTLKFSTAVDVLCGADLSQEGNKWEGATLVQKNGLLFSIRILPPAAGEYTLNIYARKGKSSDGVIPLAVCYKVIARSSAVRDASFPVTFSTFVKKNVQLHSPLSKELASGSTQVFLLTAPEAEKVSVVCGEDWNFLKKTGTQFGGTIEIGAGKVSVFAQYPGEGNFQQLLEYVGTGSVMRAPAPVKFQQYMNTGAELVGPLKKILPAGSEQFFRVKMPGAQKAAVLQGEHWQFLEKNGEYFEGTIKISAGENVVVGAYTSDTRFEGLLEYEGK
jgi:hypothetical protein